MVKGAEYWLKSAVEETGVACVVDWALRRTTCTVAPTCDGKLIVIISVLAVPCLLRRRVAKKHVSRCSLSSGVVHASGVVQADMLVGIKASTQYVASWWCRVVPGMHHVLADVAVVTDHVTGVLACQDDRKCALFCGQLA